ncbi:hypothetical protein ABEO83_01640 [Bacillus glycinifermentans]|uniref:hypothetical protein n=1 Tax=Bacillus glycinifermentans TaxID=1664069 RepID=UPI003D243C76
MSITIITIPSPPIFLLVLSRTSGTVLLPVTPAFEPMAATFAFSRPVRLVP